MTLNEAFQSAIKEGMTVYNCSLLISPNAIFRDLVGKRGNVITSMSVNNDVALDILYVNAGDKTLSVLKRAEEALALSRPIVFVSVKVLKTYTFSIKDILDYMISIGYMNLRLEGSAYAFTYEFEPSRVLL
jgi:hypothetical protein